MTKIATWLAGGALALAGGIAWADSHEHEGHGTEAAGHGAHGAMPPHMEAMMAAMDAMMADMAMESSGDGDADFLLLMIPHHQSAIDMARVVLEQGDDEETLALAREIIDAQEAEIAAMRAMLERLGVDAPAASE